MADLHSFDSAALRLLKQRIDQETHARAITLISGGARAPDAMTIATNYAEAMGYVAALQNVLDWCVDVEDELIGRKKPGSR